MDGVGTTGLLVAAIRAQESERADRLFEDPFARALAGELGMGALDRYRGDAGPGVPIIEVRTKYFDDALAAATADGIRQVVLLAAGMDARAYRLAWPNGTRLFELDQPEVLARKAQILADATPRAERIAIGVDLRTDWPRVLRESGFDASARTAWMIEGLLQYLPEDAVHALLGRVDGLSAPGSIAFFDTVGSFTLTAPFMKPALDYMASIGAPWLFGTDDPAALLAPRGWDVTPTESAVYGNTLGRWPFPAAPPGVPGIPRGYLVTASKH